MPNNKKYTQARTKLEEQFSILVSNIPGFIYILRIDVHGDASVPYASARIMELFGLSPEDVREDAHVLWSRYHPDDLIRLQMLIVESRRELSPFLIEIRIFHPTKGLRWVEIRSTPQPQEDGATEWHGIMLDITERIDDKEAMQHTQSALEEAQRIAHIGSWDVDIVNDVLSWSDETYRIWEIDKTKFAATFEAFMNTVHPDDRAKVSEAYNRSIVDKSLYQVEHRLLFADGRVKYIQEYGEPYFDASGRPIRFIGTSLDITERKRVESVVSLQNHALSHIGEAVYLVDAQARICQVNNAACKMLGYTQDELLVIRIYDLDPNYDPSNWNEHWEELLHEGTITLETQHRCKTGELIPIEVNANIIEHEGQKFNFALVRNITERKLIESQMHHQASYDMLTGLPNRRLLEDRLKEEISKADRNASNVAILFIDLDRFKEINDTLGHHQGDRLLIVAGQRIQQCVRGGDLVARMGGDEFVVMIADVTEMALLGHIAQKIAEVMANPFVLDNQISYISASIGIANYPSDTDSLEGLIGAADQAMYAAKERGRNGFCFFTPAMQKQVQERLSLANDLRDAILKQQLQIYLQPIVDVSTGEVVKAEALLRWKHPKLGMVPPDKFIPIAEEIGLIHEIGNWVFYQAALAMSHWLKFCKDEHGFCEISLNMSARQFIPSEIGIAWINHLSKINVPTNRIVIEITESLLLGDEVGIREKLNRFSEAGIKVALDDFGTGYSSMSYLKKFNIDYLKIDRSFVNDLETDSNDRAITEAIVVMAHKLGLKTIAEGVETEQQKAILAEVGCDYVQGYFYAKPMPVDEFLSFVKIKQ